jgi:hypothetical protein
MTDQAKIKRDRRLRRRLLEALQDSRVAPLAGMYGRALVDIVHGYASPSQGFEDDTHAIGLLQDLVNKGLILRADKRSRRSQPFGLDHLLYAITASGSSLLAETAGPDKDIDDDRNLEES